MIKIQYFILFSILSIGIYFYSLKSNTFIVSKHFFWFINQFSQINYHFSNI